LEESERAGEEEVRQTQRGRGRDAEAVLTVADAADAGEIQK
jgi:hypothetical protein